MAIVRGGYRASLTFVDTAGDETSRTYYLRTTVAATAETALTDLITKIDPLTEAVLKKAELTLVFDNDAFVFPAGDINVENQALVSLQLVNPGKRASFSIPAPDPAIFVAATGAKHNDVDTSNADLATFVDQFKAAGTLYISDGESAHATTPIIDGKRIHSRSSRG